MAKKKILAYGDSNTWGWIGVEEAFPSTRYGDDERWAGVMAAELGDGYDVAVDGLTVRATNLDDSMDWNAIKADMFNGAKTMPAAIAREMPVDLLIIMLGTNDLKAETDRSAEDIANAIIDVAKVAQGCGGGVAYHYEAPQVLVVSPPPVNDMPHPDFAAMFEGGKAKAEALGAALKSAADAAGIASFDASAVLGNAQGVDGLHMSKDQHAQLGRAIAERVKTL
ncbi:GDSL-type esterase/lipase family protein [Ruegeria atlantica]|uniref:GDSL-type esterase/lipase family protein n=1 Tax=Ruegeria atlantica TaxID=81569 RepID=UPI00249568BC|nr:GDSL-type esterase/lipase family protein [Ruegeria atlantica]